MAMTNTTHKAPGKFYRNGLSIKKLMEMFPTEEAAEKWFQDKIWKGTPHCHYCGSTNVNLTIKHPTMPHRCREKDCRKYFSIRTNTIMHSSKLAYRDWALATYLYNTNLKGISSMRLHRELEVTQRTAWYILHRLRHSNTPDKVKFSGVVEVDETMLGGKVSRMSKKTRKRFEEKWGKGKRASVGKDIIIGIKDRDEKQIQVDIIPDKTRPTLLGFAIQYTEEGSTIFTDEALGYVGIEGKNRWHHTINHGEDEYVVGDIHTNGIESFWFPVKEGMRSVYHGVSSKHRLAYAQEYAGRFNLREKDTIDQMGTMAYNMLRKRMTYKDLTA